MYVHTYMLRAPPMLVWGPGWIDTMGAWDHWEEKAALPGRARGSAHLALSASLSPFCSQDSSHPLLSYTVLTYT